MGRKQVNPNFKKAAGNLSNAEKQAEWTKIVPVLTHLLQTNQIDVETPVNEVMSAPGVVLGNLEDHTFKGYWYKWRKNWADGKVVAKRPSCKCGVFITL